MQKSYSIFPSLLAAAISVTMVMACTKKDDRTGSAPPEETSPSGQSSEPGQTAQDQTAIPQPAPGQAASEATVDEPGTGSPEADKQEPGGRRSETAETGRNGRGEPLPQSDPSESSQGIFPEDEETAILGSGIDPDAGYPASPDDGLDAGGVMEEGDGYAGVEMGGYKDMDRGVGGTGRIPETQNVDTCIDVDKSSTGSMGTEADVDRGQGGSGYDDVQESRKDRDSEPSARNDRREGAGKTSSYHTNDPRTGEY